MTLDLTMTAQETGPRPTAGARALRFFVIAVTAFLTVVDLFATQAILPSLTVAYGVSPAAMGVAVNASTIGMAISGLLVAVFSRAINRRLGILLSLAILAIPTALLAHAPDLATFTALRIVQGLCMAAAFTLTLAYLGEHTSAEDQAGAFAAYITGNVASNLVGRLIAASVVDTFGLDANFYLFAVLNLAGAVLVYFTITQCPKMTAMPGAARPSFGAFLRLLLKPRLARAFAIGFAILFAFIGTFTYVNFVLVRPPLGLGMMSLGVIYFVFLPSIFTTPLAGNVARRIGAPKTMALGLAVAALALPLLISTSLSLVLTGMVLMGVGTFFAQATATGFVSRAAGEDRGAASGLYLASYFLGGLVGSAVLGQTFVGLGWPATVGGIGAALLAAFAIALTLEEPGHDHA